MSRAQSAIETAIEQEETRFRRTLANGLGLLEEAAAELTEGGELSGDVAFTLNDTYGFPLDLTQDILRGRGMTVDTQGYDKALEEQRERSRQGGFASGDAATDTVWFDVHAAHGRQRVHRYEGTRGSGKLLAIVQNGAQMDEGVKGLAELVFDRTPFYAESGGQAGDHGDIIFESGAEFKVSDVQKRAAGLHVHIGELSASVKPANRLRFTPGMIVANASWQITRRHIFCMPRCAACSEHM